jgi:hypothetical protein
MRAGSTSAGQPLRLLSDLCCVPVDQKAAAESLKIRKTFGRRPAAKDQHSPSLRRLAADFINRAPFVYLLRRLTEVDRLRDKDSLPFAGFFASIRRHRAFQDHTARPGTTAMP